MVFHGKLKKRTRFLPFLNDPHSWNKRNKKDSISDICKLFDKRLEEQSLQVWQSCDRYKAEYKEERCWEVLLTMNKKKKPASSNYFKIQKSIQYICMALEKHQKNYLQKKFVHKTILKQNFRKHMYKKAIFILAIIVFWFIWKDFHPPLHFSLCMFQYLLYLKY